MVKHKKNNKESFFSKYLSIQKVNNKIKNLSYLPRWIIIGIDVSVLIVAFLLTYFLFEEVGSNYVHRQNIEFFLFSLLGINIFFFWLFRTYSGIIRHSTFTDAIKIMYSQTSVLVFFIFFNIFYNLYFGESLFKNSALFINIVLSFCGLFFYRVFVKQMYESFFIEKIEGKLIKIVIYGTDANAISIAKALNFEANARFKILGFVDKNLQNASKQMFGLPILVQKKKFSTLMRTVGAEGVIIADNSLTKEDQLTLIDQCLEFNFKVYVVPKIIDWENQKEISKKVKNIQIEDLLERKPIVLDNQSISKQLEGKIILVTGAAGSIGSEIVRQVLMYSPKEIIILDQAETPLHHLSLELANQGFDLKLNCIIADIRNKEAISRIFKLYRPEVVFHAAAYKHVPLMEDNPSQAILNNVEGTKNIADLSLLYNVRNFVMISTDKAVNPSNVMGASKRIAEKYVQSLQLKNIKENSTNQTKFITTRFGNVLGSNGSVVPLFSSQIASGGPLTITHQDITRYFMTIPEACQLVLEAASMGNGGEIYIFDMGKPIKIIDLARKMIKLAGFIPDVDIQIKIVGLRPGEKLYEELLNDTSKTIPTHHEKITIALEIQEEFEELHADINELIGIASFFDNDDIVAKMKKIVPEFVSMNSTFQILDKK